MLMNEILIGALVAGGAIASYILFSNRKKEVLNEETNIEDKSLNMSNLDRINYFNSYSIPTEIKLRYMKEFDRTEIEYHEIESALMDFFSIFLPGNYEENKFYTFPSIVADDLWHTFLLYSKEYREFCMNSFGRIIDHEPHTEEKPENAEFKTVWNTYSILNKRNGAKAFDLDRKYNVRNKYDLSYMRNIDRTYYASSRTRDEDNLLLALGLITLSDFLSADEDLIEPIYTKAYEIKDIEPDLDLESLSKSDSYESSAEDLWGLNDLNNKTVNEDEEDNSLLTATVISNQNVAASSSYSADSYDSDSSSTTKSSSSNDSFASCGSSSSSSSSSSSGSSCGGGCGGS